MIINDAGDELFEECNDELKKHYKNLKYKNIQPPNEDVETQIIIRDPYLINLLDNPCEQSQLIAYKESPSLIKCMKAISENVALLTVGNNPSYLQYIPNITKEVQYKAIKRCGTSIEFEDFILPYIDITDVDIQACILSEHPNYVWFFRTYLYDELKLKLIKKYQNMIFVFNPHEIYEYMELEVLKIMWTKNFYNKLEECFGPHSKPFYKEINRLKLEKGPMK